MAAAYISMYAGWPLPSNAAISFNNPGSADTLKFAIVIGSNRIDEANIAGITPAVLSLRGKCVLSPANILLPICLFGYWTINLL